MVTPMEKCRAALEAHGCATNGAPHEFRAECPAHSGGGHKALRVTEGLDGRVLLICQNGCTAEKIVEVLGLRMRDLFTAEITRHRWRRPDLRRPPHELLSANHARLSRLIRLLDEAGEKWNVSLGLDCPVCGSPGAWLRGSAVLTIDCSEGCPQEAIIWQLELAAARRRVERDDVIVASRR